MAGTPVKRERLRRFGELVAPENEEQTLLALEERISRGMGFDAICRELDQPRTRFLVWLQADEERWSFFLKAHEARAINYVSEAMGIADGEGDAADKKLRVETRFRYAKHHAPGLYGGDEGGAKGTSTTLNVTIKQMGPAVAVGSVGPGLVVEGEVVRQQIEVKVP